MFGRITYHHTQLAAFAFINHHVGFHQPSIQFNAVRLRAVHNTKTTALLGHTLFILDKRHIIHVLFLFSPLAYYGFQQLQLATAHWPFQAAAATFSLSAQTAANS